MKLIFYFLVFPGFLFTAVIGLLASWVDRKVTARVQWRVGPPWYQPFADFLKLLGKETILPKTAAKLTFLFSPLLSLVAVTIVATMLGRMIIYPNASFLGDLIVILYLLTIPSLAIILSGFASGNPLASLGASREMKLILGYELPFVLAAIVCIIKAGGTIKVGQIINYQLNNGSILASFSGAIAFIVAVIAMQAKLTLVPFDIPEAETEIMAGPFIEYSGTLLAIFKLAKAMLLVVLPTFLISLFLAGNLSVWSVIWKYVVLLVIIVLVRNTNPRVRIDQAIKFFWGPVTLFAIIAVILALFGK